MEKFYIDGEIDLELTLTCGQTFCWHRMDGELYGSGRPEFYTFRNGKPIIAREEEGRVMVETSLAQREAEEALGAHHDLEEVFADVPEDEPLETAKEELWGLRIVQDEFFPCLISYLCSPQMRIPRIKQMHDGIAERYGEKHEVDGAELLKFPEPEQLREASEQELRDLGVGYRAEYIEETTRQFQELDEEEIRKMDYEDAKEELKQLHGVGEKVADCVLLFSLGFYEAYPIDTWAQKSLKQHYPELHSEDYRETSQNMRRRFGKFSGYAQEYLFHAAREGIIEVEK
ncbi:MAG: DNA-3-methyladenine glycosylase [Candidatus Nanohaloarchaea archaeon]